MHQALAPLLFDDDRTGVEATRTSVVAPAQISPRAQDKARRKRTAAGWPVHSFRTLLDDLTTLARNRIVPHLPGPNHLMCSLGPPRYSARPSNCSVFDWKAPSSGTYIFLIYT